MGRYKTKTEEIESTRLDHETGELIETTVKKTFVVKKMNLNHSFKYT